MIRRLRPLLGAFVRVEVEACGAQTEAAVAEAFGAVAAAHHAMSFHEEASDLSRLNRAEPGAWTQVSAACAEVLALALAAADLSGGAFDPVVAAAAAVAGGELPRPPRAADAAASWRDVELEGGRVRLRRACWIDLGGVAKGWAVDGAVRILRRAAPSGVVEAGGDLRAWGAAPRAVALDAAAGHAAAVPVVELLDAAVASSGGVGVRRGLAAQAHVDGRDGRPLRGAFAAVVAPDCVWADALTKVVLALGPGSEPLLRRQGAVGHHLKGGRWRAYGGPCP